MSLQQHKFVLIGFTGAIASVSTIVYLYRKICRLELSLEHEKQKRGDERIGRTNAEEKVRKLALQLQSIMSGGAKCAPSDEAIAGVSDESNALNDVKPIITQQTYHVIGYVESCYRRRLGTPRQGKLVPEGYARIKINKHIVLPRAALDGLTQYSHVWLLFIFHENTNVTKDHVIDEIIEGKEPRINATFKAYVRPPRLQGGKVGLFATRTPHRPNNIGLTLATLVEVDLESGVVTIGAHDLIDGTPILDIKPFIPAYDQAHGAQLKVPHWVDDSPVQLLNDIVISEQVKAQIEQLCSSKALAFYPDAELFCKVLSDVLRQDIRSRHQRNLNNPQEVHRLLFDNLCIHFRIHNFVGHVEYAEYVPDHHKYRGLVSHSES
eukprot:TRINITY_DN9471_c0_g1_i3.p1 TRINITY_DN9471_c0_g1~~TRINITY_DN9471_c0_g1_i3.p1  ORF type:complete len:379 (-),score=49.06 TRINITY_DN9471_c0_g1_i3:160-1296(-)